MRGREKLQQHPPSFSPVCDVLQLDLGLFVHNYKNHCCLISFLLSLFFLSLRLLPVNENYKSNVRSSAASFSGSAIHVMNEVEEERDWFFSHRMEFVSIEWKIPRDDSQLRRYAIKCMLLCLGCIPFINDEGDAFVYTFNFHFLGNLIFRLLNPEIRGIFRWEWKLNFEAASGFERR